MTADDLKKILTDKADAEALAWLVANQKTPKCANGYYWYWAEVPPPPNGPLHFEVPATLVKHMEVKKFADMAWFHSKEEAVRAFAKAFRETRK